MKREDAIELANVWHDLAGDDSNVGPAYSALQRTAKQLVPDDVTAGGAAIIDGVPTMLALTSGGLFLAHSVTNDDGQSLTIRLKRLPVAGDVTVEVTDGIAGKRGGRDALMHRWKFVWPGGASVEFDAATHVYGWNEGPDSAELLARALAATVGWSFPKGDG